MTLSGRLLTDCMCCGGDESCCLCSNTEPVSCECPRHFADGHGSLRPDTVAKARERALSRRFYER